MFVTEFHFFLDLLMERSIHFYHPIELDLKFLSIFQIQTEFYIFAKPILYQESHRQYLCHFIQALISELQQHFIGFNQSSIQSMTIIDFVLNAKRKKNNIPHTKDFVHGENIKYLHTAKND